VWGVSRWSVLVTSDKIVIYEKNADGEFVRKNALGVIFFKAILHHRSSNSGSTEIEDESLGHLRFQTTLVKS
jgi:hypothetical protein